MSLKAAVRRVLERLLGSSGYQVLAYHIRKVSKMEPEELFLSNSLEFYQVLLNILGRGADFFVEMLLKSLMVETGLPSFDVAEAVRELREGKFDKVSQILSKLEEVVRG